MGGLKRITLFELASDPSPHADQCQIYAKDDSGRTELFFMDQGGSITQITKDGYLDVQYEADVLGLPYELIDPSIAANKGSVYTKKVSGNVELFYIDGIGTVTQLTSEGSTIVKGNLTELNSGVLNISNGTDAVLGTGTSIQVKKATAVQDGYLGKNDWTTFNNKADVSGSDGYVQYNNDGYLGNATNLYWDDINSRLGVGTAAPSDVFHVVGGVPSGFGGDSIYEVVEGEITYRVHKFTTVGNSVVFLPNGVTSVEYLVVGGGGAGGYAYGGGGGAGGYRTGTLSVTAQSYTVTVGAGGIAPTDGTARSGENSVFATITAAGGGGGGNLNGYAAAGGSGGGGGGLPYGYGGSNWRGDGNTPSTDPAQGYNGGSGVGSTDGERGAGGGGGASQAGETGYTNRGGYGGNGASSSISGTTTTYAGGGGGGCFTFATTTYRGGSGGGGASAAYTIAATAGTPNTGGGGGGGAQYCYSPNTIYPGGAGGSGIVIVRYPIIVSGGGKSIFENDVVGIGTTDLDISSTVGRLVVKSLGTNIFVGRNSSDVNIASIDTFGGLTLGADSYSTGQISLVGVTSGTVVVKPADIAGAWTMTLPSAVPALDGYILSATDGGICSWIAAKDGDIVGPSSATDNAIVRFDLATGKLIQNSLVIIGDDGYVNIPSGQKYKINGVNLSATDVGAEPTLTKGAISSGTASAIVVTNGGSSTVGPNVSVSINKASASLDGYLGKNDWTTFNNKISGAAGSDGYVQYNNSGSFGGATSLYWDDASSRLGIGTKTPIDIFHVIGAGATPSGSGGDSIYEVVEGGITYRVHKFTTVGTSSITIPSGVSSVTYLVVAGGGGSGDANGGGGGGGAGGYRTGTLSVSSGSYTVTVGAGGARTPYGSGDFHKGEDSVFSTITSAGGGYGGRGSAGGAGGSGGGGSYVYAGGAASPANQGFAGGNGADWTGGGGGGAGAVGANSASQGNGGAGGVGLQSSISGTATYYAGGGGGGAYSAGGSGAVGGSGGGGHGGGVPTNGTANTGGGAGGGSDGNGGAAGGSGIVIVRYALAVAGGRSIFENNIVSIGTTELSGSPTVGRLVIKASGTSNIFVGRNSSEVNVAYIDGYGKLNLGAASSVTGQINLIGTTSGVVGLKVADAAGTWTMTLPAAVPAVTGYVLSATTGGVCSWVASASGTGDVVGPGSSTNEGIARFDGTTGKLIQNSLVTIGDDGYVNIPSGQKYKINNTNLAATDVGAEPTLAKTNLTETASSIFTITNGSNSVIGASPVTIQVNKASASLDGYLGKNDWTTFNAKEPAVTKGNLTETSSSILVFSGTTTNNVIGTGTAIQVKKASVSQDGYLGKDDFYTFSSGGHNPVTLNTSAITGGLSLNTQEISFRAATTSLDGYLKSSDWNTFNSKEPTVTKGNLTETSSSILVFGGTTTNNVIGSGTTIQVIKASASQDGYLGKDNWATFNAKEPAVTKGNLTELNSGVLTITGGTGSVIGSGATIQVKKSSALQDGYLGKDDFATFSSGGHNPVTLNASAITGGLSLNTQEISFRAADTTYDGYLKSSDWDTFNGKMTDPMSARGDIIYRNSSNVTDRLALGDDGYLLASNGTDVIWKKPSISYISQDFTSQTSVVVDHNLGAYPVVQVLDSGKEVVIPQSIVNNSVNSFTVTFPEATSGTILVTLGTSSSVGGSGGTLSKSFMISNPTAAASSPLWRVPANSIITHIHILCIGGTNIVGQLWEYDSNGANGATVDSDITAVAGTNADDDGDISNPNIAAGNYLGWKTTSVSGTPTGVIVTFEYTED